MGMMRLSYKKNTPKNKIKNAFSLLIFVYNIHKDLVKNAVVKSLTVAMAASQKGESEDKLEIKNSK